MEPKFINYCQPLVPTLRNISIVPIVARLLAKPDIEKELKILIDEVNELEKPCHFVVGRYNFSKIEEIIQEGLNSMPIPKQLHAELLNFVKPMGLMIIKCIDLRGSDYNRLYNSGLFEESFYWTSRGTIDKARALEQRVFRNNQKTDLGILFSYACEYCCENCIFEIWERIPEDKRENFIHSGRGLCYITLGTYWGYRLENKQPDYRNHITLRRRKDSIHSVMLELAILRENFLAAKYFWNRLPLEEKKNDNIIHWLDKVARNGMNWYRRQVPSELTDIMLFLLSRLSDPSFQRKFFEKYSEVILKALYNHWPHQVYFLPTINVMWDYLDKDLYTEIVSIMSEDAKERMASRELLKDLWHCSPEKFRVLVSAESLNILQSKD